MKRPTAYTNRHRIDVYEKQLDRYYANEKEMIRQLRNVLERFDNIQRRTDKPTVFRRGTKAAKVLAMLREPGGATAPEIAAEVNWSIGAVRSFISGQVARRLGLVLNRSPRSDGALAYSLVAD